MTRVYFMYGGEKWWVKQHSSGALWTTRHEEEAAVMTFQSALKAATELRQKTFEPVITWLPRPNPALRAINKAQELS